jgi:hypothetical protein
MFDQGAFLEEALAAELALKEEEKKRVSNRSLCVEK